VTQVLRPDAGELEVRIQARPETVFGEFVEIDPPRRLVFTWGWEGDEEVPPGSSTVEVTLTPDGDATVLHLVHGDLPWSMEGAM
jgi:uncharacterized protein YndB with AHSA1/START domain